MRRAESHTSPRVSPRMPKPMTSCHCARPRASATSSSRGAARTRVSGSPTSTWIGRLPPIHARPWMGRVVCPRIASSGRVRSCLSAGSSRSVARVRTGSPGPGRISRSGLGWAITNPRRSTSAIWAEGVTRDCARWRDSSWSVMSAPTTVPAGPAPLGERGADLARREEDVRARPDERRARHRLPVPLAGPRVEAVVGPRVVPDHGELPVQEDVAPRRRAVTRGQALDQERGLRGRVEALPHGRAQRAHEKEVTVAEADVHGRDLGMCHEGGGEQREGFEPRRKRGRPGQRVSREELDQEAGGGEQVAHLVGGVLRDVQELFVAGREQEPRSGAVAVGDDGQAGGGDERHEQRRDVHAEAERPVSRVAGLGASPRIGRTRSRGIAARRQC